MEGFFWEIYMNSCSHFMNYVIFKHVRKGGLR